MGFLHKFCVNVTCTVYLDLSTGMVQANDVARPMSRHSERTPLVLGGTQLHGKTMYLCCAPQKEGCMGT